MNKKYLICPGTIVSRTDLQEHFISARALMSLYGVNPALCLIRRSNTPLSKEEKSLIALYPREDGNYELTS